LSTFGHTPDDPEEMSCKELVEVITDYLEDALPGHDRIRFDTHLWDCRWCRNYLEQMRATIAAVGTLSEEAIAPETREQLVSAFRGWRAAR
jgi:anti-sigma factor RsiW